MSDRLSVVIATGKPWPEVRSCLDSLRDQARALDVEILLVDGDGEALPEAAVRTYPNVRRLRQPGASVFALRAWGLSEAAGDIIAVTEDHCRVPADWCQEILRAHGEHPDAAAIGGAVENAATDRLMDRANFALVFSPFLPPIRDGESEEIALQANISYKRRVIPADMGRLGMMEFLFNRQLRERGEVLVADGRIVVHHDQSHGFLGTLAMHFHNGRSIAGFRLPDLSGPGRVARVLSTALLPPFLFYRTLGNLARKRRLTGGVLASVPLLAALVVCHAAGELVGYLTGPGGSPRHIA